ncbi:MAG: ribosome maturation factor RimM [Clostridiales bacterium]|jgi:16S rRNA processing protein RimM|nr:ribosome maturation factor RimM [Clostridiales bacterium]
MDTPLEIGKIVNTHGLKGEVKVTPWCDEPSVFSRLERVILSGREVAITAVKYHKNSVILKLDGIDGIAEADALRNVILYVERAWLGALPEGTYYVTDLIGLAVYAEGKPLGKIEDCFSTGSNDVYAVRSDDGRQLLLPAIQQVIKRVDLPRGVMEVALMEGLEYAD